MNIKRMLSRNGYPNSLLDRCIQQFLNRKHGVTQQRDSLAEPSPSPKYTVFHYNYRVWVLYLTTYGTQQFYKQVYHTVLILQCYVLENITVLISKKCLYL